jgi:hypothetical protein
LGVHYYFRKAPVLGLYPYVLQSGYNNNKGGGGFFFSFLPQKERERERERKEEEEKTVYKASVLLHEENKTRADANRRAARSHHKTLRD